MVDFFACLGGELVEMSVGIGNKQDRSCSAAHLVKWAPSQAVDWAGIFASSLNLCNFIVCSQVEHPHTPITISTGRHRVFLIKPCHHHFCIFRYDRLHQHLVLQWNLLSYPAWMRLYLCCAFGFLFCILTSIGSNFKSEIIPGGISRIP